MIEFVNTLIIHYLFRKGCVVGWVICILKIFFWVQDLEDNLFVSQYFYCAALVLTLSSPTWTWKAGTANGTHRSEVLQAMVVVFSANNGGEIVAFTTQTWKKRFFPQTILLQNCSSSNLTAVTATAPICSTDWQHYSYMVCIAFHR